MYPARVQKKLEGKEPKTILIDDGEDIHLLPERDIVSHVVKASCPCRPEPDEENLQDFKMGRVHRLLWKHNRMSDVSKMH
jgi:hypothetical protein